MNAPLPSTLRFLRVVWPTGSRHEDDERHPDARHLWRVGSKEWGNLDGTQTELEVHDVWRRRDRVRRAINAQSPADVVIVLYAGTGANAVDVWPVPGILSRDAQALVEPVTIRDARAFVDTHHSHHKAPIGAKFALGITQYGRLQCVAMVGRPVSRMLARDGTTWEITREACDAATPGMASRLIRASADEAIRRGARHVVSYTLLGETGASYRGARFHPSGVTRGGEWSRPSRGRAPAQQSRPKIRWSYGPDAPARDMEAERLLREHAGAMIPSRFDADDDDAELETRENPTRGAAGPYTIALWRAAQAVDAKWARVTSSRTQRGALEELASWAGPRLTLGDLVRVDDADGCTVALYLCDGYALRTAPRFPATVPTGGGTRLLDMGAWPTDRSAARWIETWEGSTSRADVMVRVCDRVTAARLALAATDCAEWALSLGTSAELRPSYRKGLEVARAALLGDVTVDRLHEALAGLVAVRSTGDLAWHLNITSTWAVRSALDASLAAVTERADRAAVYRHATSVVLHAGDAHATLRSAVDPSVRYAAREDFEALAPIFRRHMPLSLVLCALAKLPDPLALEQTRENPARTTSRRHARGAVPMPSTHRLPLGPRRLVGIRPTRA